jgi:hypothetical protein
VQGATDVGLDIVTLPFYYGLAEGAWRHWSRVWEVDYDYLQSRFDSQKIMQTPGIPLTRWFDAVLLPKDQVDQKDNLRAMFVQGHASNSITRIPPLGPRWRSMRDAKTICICCRLAPSSRRPARASPRTARCNGASRSSSRSSSRKTHIRLHDRVWFATGEEIVRAWLQSGATF